MLCSENIKANELIFVPQDSGLLGEMDVARVFQRNVVNTMAAVFISFKGCHEYTEGSGACTVWGVQKTPLELNP